MSVPIECTISPSTISPDVLSMTGNCVGSSPSKQEPNTHTTSRITTPLIGVSRTVIESGG